MYRTESFDQSYLTDIKWLRWAQLNICKYHRNSKVFGPTCKILNIPSLCEDPCLSETKTMDLGSLKIASDNGNDNSQDNWDHQGMNWVHFYNILCWSIRYLLSP